MKRLTEQIIDKNTGKVTGYKPIENRNAFQICNRLGKYEDAIQELQERINLIDSDYPDMEDYKAVLELAVAALEKQIPSRAIERFTGDEYVCECPVCGGITSTPNEVVAKSIQYCGWCGQKLDWSDEQ